MGAKNKTKQEMEVVNQDNNVQCVLYKQRGVDIGMELKDKMAELVKTREQIDRAREIAMHSYLESKPLIDRLEKSKAALEKLRSQHSMLGGQSSYEIRSQLEAIEAALREKKEEEVKATRSNNEMNQAAEEIGSEIDSLKADIEEERRNRQKLKQTLRMKRQKLRAIHLMLRAVRIESDAMKASFEYAVQQADLAKTEVSVVHFDQEEYWALRRRAEEEESLAEWRIMTSVKQKAAAEESRNLALKRLEDAKEGNRLRRRRTTEGANKKKINKREEWGEEENKQDKINNGEQRPKIVRYGRRASPIARTRELMEIRNGKRPRRARGNNKKKKQSIFAQIRSFFAKMFR